MQAYIEDIFLQSKLNTKENYIVINFSGCDFKCTYCNKPHLIEFKKQHQQDIKKIKARIREFAGIATTAILCGGEPCIQRHAVQEILKYCKSLNLKTNLKTNATSPYTLNSILKAKLVDKIIIELKSPLIKKTFQNTTNSSTFFKPTEQIITNIKKSLQILKKYQGKIAIIIKTVIVPGIIYKKEDILEIAKSIHKINCLWVFKPFSNQNIKNNLSSINPPSKTFLNNLKNHCLKQYPSLRITIRF